MFSLILSEHGFGLYSVINLCFGRKKPKLQPVSSPKVNDSRNHLQPASSPNVNDSCNHFLKPGLRKSNVVELVG